MNDRVANQRARHRAKLEVVNRAEFKPLWEGLEPARVGELIGDIQADSDTLANDIMVQSRDNKGLAQDKAREEKELEEEAYNMAGLVAAYAFESGDEMLAVRYDNTITMWRQMRDEALILKVRDLEADAGALVAGADTLAAASYGITAGTVAALKTEADQYEALIIAPRTTITSRAELTKGFPDRVRALNTRFDILGRLLRVFRGTATGDAFYAAYVAADQVFDLGHGPGTGNGGTDGGGNASGSSESSEDDSSSFESSSSSEDSFPSSSSSFFSSSSSSFESSSSSMP